MEVNRYYQYTPQARPAQSTYIPLPYEDLMNAGAFLQKEEDQAKAEMLNIGNKQYKGMSQDYEYLQKAQNEINTNLNKLYDKYKDKGMRLAADEIRKMKNELAQREGQFGDIGAIQSNLAAYQEYEKELNKQLEKGDIDLDTYKYKLNRSMDDYKGIGTPDPQGRYKSFIGRKAAKNVDLIEQADKLIKDWKESGGENIRENPNGTGYLVKKGNSWEAVTYDEVYNSVLPALMQKEENKTYAEQIAEMSEYEAMKRGEQYGDPNALIGYDENGNIIQYNPNTYRQTKYIEPFQRAADFAARKASYQKNKNTIDLSNDQLFYHNQEKLKELNQIQGSSIEGMTVNLLGDDGKSLVKGGILKDDGTINWGNVTQKVPTTVAKTGPSAMMFGTSNEGTSYKTISRAKELQNTIKKMATVLGIDFQTTSAKNGDYDRIYKQFNEFSKTRGFDVQLAPQIATNISSYINKGGLANYTIQANNEGEYMDLTNASTNITKLVKDPNTTIEVVNRRDVPTTKNGKESTMMVLEGLVKGKNGEILGKVNLRPKSQQEVNYFDKIGELQNEAMRYMTTSTINYKGDKDNKQLREEVGSSYLNALKANPFQYDAAINSLQISENEKPILVDQVKLPTGDQINILANPKIPGLQAYVDQNGIVYNSIGDVKVAMDMKYYGTQSGAVWLPEAKNKTQLNSNFFNEED